MAPRDDCLLIVRHLWPSLDGALPEALQERIAEHLAECTNCRSHFDFARSFLLAIRQYGGVDADTNSEPLRARVLKALAAAGDNAS